MVDAMPSSVAGMAIARQVVRSGTSPSANYRAACLAKSDKDFINKLKMVEEELDVTTKNRMKANELEKNNSINK